MRERERERFLADELIDFDFDVSRMSRFYSIEAPGSVVSWECDGGVPHPLPIERISLQITSL